MDNSLSSKIGLSGGNSITENGSIDCQGVQWQHHSSCFWRRSSCQQCLVAKTTNDKQQLKHCHNSTEWEWWKKCCPVVATWWLMFTITWLQQVWNSITVVQMDSSGMSQHNSADFSSWMQAIINRQENEQVSVQKESSGNGQHCAVVWQCGSQQLWWTMPWPHGGKAVVAAASLMVTVVINNSQCCSCWGESWWQHLSAVAALQLCLEQKAPGSCWSKKSKWQGAINSWQLYHQGCLMATASLTEGKQWQWCQGKWQQWYHLPSHGSAAVGTVVVSQQLFLEKSPDHALLLRTTMESNN